MAARRFEQILNIKFGRYISALIYAVLEWVLIVLLFLDGIIAFVVSEIARFFELETPCLLCSRIDRVFTGRDPDFYYRDLICDSHAREIPSLAYCHIHRKLSNINKMCEGCLSSNPEEKKSNSEATKLPIIRQNDSVQVNFDSGAEKCIKTNMRESSKKTSIQCCSCCNGPLRIGPHFQRQARVASIGCEPAREFSVPSQVLVHRESLMKKRESNAKRTKGSCSTGNLSHIGYMELRATSDMESENREGPCISSQGVGMIMNSLPTIRVSEPSVGIPNEQLHLIEHDLSARDCLPQGLQRPPSEILAVTQVNFDSKDSKDLGLEGSSDSKSSIGEATLLANKIIDNTYKIAEVNSRTPTFRNLFHDFPFAKKETPKAREDIKFVVSQGLGYPWTEVSGAPSPSGLQPPQQKRSSIERDESGVDSLDGSIVSEIEGESMADRLKRQIQLDHKSLIALYQELDEERNSSAVAANQAMAMITRLQEEKATVQMKALQYQRMMEEQAEYDQDALQVMNELLIKREKEIKVLEAEVETYRKRFQYEVAEELGQEGTRNSIEKYREVGSDYYSEMGWKDYGKNGLVSVDYQELKSRSPSTKSEEVSSSYHDQNGPGTGEWKEKDTTILGKLLSDFEDERLYLLERLKILKEKSCSCSNRKYKIPNDMDDETHWDKEDGNSSTQGTGNVTETSLGDKINSPTVDATGIKIEMSFHENFFPAVPVQESTSSPVLVSGSREISHLSERLETLEADKEFLKHAVASLQKGGEGAQLLQEIAQHLRELRRPLDDGFAS